MPWKLVSPYDNNIQGLVVPQSSNLQVIARYKSLVSIAVSASVLTIVRVVNEATLERALDERPEYVSGEWPKRRSYERVEDDLSALRKFKALLDFGIEGPMGSADEVAVFHSVAFAETIKNANASTRYKIYAFHAEIWSDGSATWGYEAPVVGEQLPRLNTAEDLDEYLQSLTRIDIRRLLEASSQSR